MPILFVDLVVRPGERAPASAARVLADLAGEMYGSQPGDTWVTVREIPAEGYAENHSPDGVYFPAIIHVLRMRLPDKFALAAEAARLAEMAGQALGRPADNVHIIFEPSGGGRVAFGGRLTAPLG
jgi:phenylpyruvate tautomerase PptA (4-oxalocrotonate tautomerase family)